MDVGQDDEDGEDGSWIVVWDWDVGDLGRIMFGVQDGEDGEDGGSGGRWCQMVEACGNGNNGGNGGSSGSWWQWWRGENEAAEVLSTLLWTRDKGMSLG